MAMQRGAVFLELGRKGKREGVGSDVKIENWRSGKIECGFFLHKMVQIMSGISY